MSTAPQKAAADPSGVAGGLNVQFCRQDARAAFRALLQYMPMALAVHELMRMRALAEVGVLPTPLLDVGCGDGLFWEVLTRDLLSGKSENVAGLVGIDINADELKLASVRLSPIGGDVRKVDITDQGSQRALDDRLGTFKTVIANCSLEHVPKLELALANIKRHMAPDGELFLFVPAPRWSDAYVVKRVLNKISSRLGGTYGGMWDGFYRHHHLYSGNVWTYLLRGVGFESQVRAIGSKRANVIRELWLPPALLSFLYKCVFKHYPARLVAPLKYWYLPRIDEFLAEVERGSVVHDDLENPEVIEYVIRARIAQ